MSRAKEVGLLGTSTPDALWNAPESRVLRPSAIACRGLRRQVGGRLLLDGLTLEVPAGMRLLVISDPEDSAPLLLRVLAGLARPDGGSTELAGLTDASRAGWARRVAYVGPEQGLWPWMTPREVLALAERLHGAPGWHVDRLVTALGIGAALNQPLSWGSEAMVERVALAAALLRDPEVLLLDEPLPSLDPEERSRILSLPGRRRTILLASRQPATEAGHCTHVALLREGGLAFLATVAELAARDLPLSVRGVEALAVA